jgi:hypothetical protein
VVATGAGKVSVLGSDIRAAVNAKLQRLKVRCPPFVRKANLTLRSRQQVIDEAVAKIMRRDPVQGMVIRARLIYGRLEQGKGQNRYLPGVALLVESDLTPFEVLVPVAR